MRGDYYLHRTWCEVLEEMRQCYKTFNFSPVAGLIEELQSMGNRMEAAIGEMGNIKRIREEWGVETKKASALERRKDRLEEEVDQLEKRLEEIQERIGDDEE